MEQAVVAAAGHHPPAIQKQHGAALQGEGAHRQGIHSRADEGLRKQLAGRNYRQHASSSVVVVPDDLHPAGQHHPHKPGRLPLQKHRVALWNFGHPFVQAAKYFRHFLPGNARKQRTPGQNFIIGFHNRSFVGIPTYVFAIV